MTELVKKEELDIVIYSQCTDLVKEEVSSDSLNVLWEVQKPSRN